MKEGSEYTIEFSFRVQRDVVLGLKFLNLVYKMGMRVDKQTHVIGSFAPQADAHVFALDSMVAPSGMLARGKYRARSKFVDDDGTVHLDFEYNLSARPPPRAAYPPPGPCADGKRGGEGDAGGPAVAPPLRCSGAHSRPPADIKKSWD